MLLLLLGRAHRVQLVLSVARVQALVDLEPVELELVPELLALLVHDIGDALIAVLLLLDVLVLLLLVVVVRLLPLPEVVHFLHLGPIGAHRGAHGSGSHEVLNFLLQLLLLLLVLVELALCDQRLLLI